MTDISVISNKRLDLENSNNYILSIRVSPDGFLFSILNHFSNTYLFFREVQVAVHLQTEKLKTLFETEAFLQKEYYRVILETCHAASTLMPALLFDSNKAAVYFNFDNATLPNHQVVYNNLSAYQVVNVFALDNTLFDLLELKLGKIEVLHQHTTLLAQNCVVQTAQSYPYRIYIQVHKGWFDMMLVKGNTLLLLNAYEHIGYNDILYFVLNGLKQFKIQPIEVALVLSGTDGAELEHLLSDYIGVVVKDERTDRAEFAPEFFTIPAHEYSNFFYIPFCE